MHKIYYILPILSFFLNEFKTRDTLMTLSLALVYFDAITPELAVMKREKKGEIDEGIGPDANESSQTNPVTMQVLFPGQAGLLCVYLLVAHLFFYFGWTQVLSFPSKISFRFPFFHFSIFKQMTDEIFRLEMYMFQSLIIFLYDGCWKREYSIDYLIHSVWTVDSLVHV